MISAADFLKQQKQTTAPTIPTSNTSGNIISADQFLKQQKSPIPTPTVQPTIPQPQSTGLSQPNQGAIGDFLKGLVHVVPGLSRGLEVAAAPPSKDVLGQYASIIPAFGQDVLNLGKGIAGAPIRLGLSLLDLFGGQNGTPKTLNVPILGPQQSAQTGERAMINQGVNPLLAGGISAVGTIMDSLGLKVLGGAFKPRPTVEAPIVPPPVESSIPIVPREPTIPTVPREPAVPGAFGADFVKQQQQGISPNNLSLDLLNTIKQDTSVLPKPEPVAPPEVVPTNQELAMQNLIKSREKPTIPPPAETAIPKVDTQAQNVMDQLVKPEVKPQNILDKLSQLNPFKFETTKIEATGPAGTELVNRGRRAQADQIAVAGEFKKLNESTGITKLTPEEQNNWRDVMEGKATPMNGAVAHQAQVWRPIMDEYGQKTGVPMVENYFHRKLNEQGRQFYDLPQNKEAVINKIMTDTGGDRASAVDLLTRGYKKGSFEFSRILQDVAPEHRVKPLEELYAWQNDVARRIGVIKNFGPKNELVRNLVSDIGKGDPHEMNLKKSAQTYIDRVTGKIYDSSPADPMYNFLKSTMVISKINPLTTLNNEFQAHINSYLQYGMKGLADATFGKEGKQLANEVGLDTIKGKIGDEVVASNFATKWMKAVGMEGSEARGMARTASSTYSAINRAFDSLKKNPGDTKSYQLLKDHAMYLDDTTLVNDLAKGQISPDEMKYGIIEGVRQKMFFNTAGERPAWANSGAGSTAYMFKNYLMSQMKLLSKAPLDRQLAYILVISPLVGTPTLLLRRFLQGKDLPTSIPDAYLQGISAGPGTPADIYQSTTTSPQSLLNFAIGGFGPYANIATSIPHPETLPKAIVGATVPGSTLLLNHLFPPKK